MTSDSLAGRLTVVLAASELVLLKSMGLPVAGPRPALTALRESGYVDPFLHLLATELPPLRIGILPVEIHPSALSQLDFGVASLETTVFSPSKPNWRPQLLAVTKH